MFETVSLLSIPVSIHDVNLLNLPFNVLSFWLKLCNPFYHFAYSRPSKCGKAHILVRQLLCFDYF